MSNAKLTTNKLVNKDFERAVRQLRRILPKLSFTLLIGTYLISALIMGLFHAQSATNIGFYIASFAVPLAIQAGRGTLVFFFQLNPARIQSRYSMGMFSATLLLFLSLFEAYLVMADYGLGWTLSVGTLMLIGYIIEIMIMKETMFATKMELYQNRDQWNELQKFYVAQSDFEQFMDDLHEGKIEPRPDRESFRQLETNYKAIKEENLHLKSRTIQKEETGKKPVIKVLEPHRNGHRS